MTIVGLNILIHFGIRALAISDPGLVERVEERFWVVGGPGLTWWGPVTSAFLHADWIHLLGNMVALWVFGQAVEDKFRRLGFIAFYLAGAVSSGLIHAVFEVARIEIAPGVEVVRPVPAIGASGAIAAVTGAFLVFFPRTHIRVFSLLFIIGVVMVPAWWFIGFKIAFDLLSQSFGVENGVANLAHLAGYFGGALLCLGLLKLKLLSPEPTDLFSTMKQAKRRADIKDAARHFEKRQEQRLAPEKREDPGYAEREAASSARSEVATLVAQDRLDEAAEKYARLVADHPLGATLARDAQYRIATHLYQSGDPSGAVSAFVRLLDANPGDRESADIRVLLGRIYARDLLDHTAAAAMLERAIADLPDGEVKDLARAELAAVRPAGGNA